MQIRLVQHSLAEIHIDFASLCCIGSKLLASSPAVPRTPTYFHHHRFRETALLHDAGAEGHEGDEVEEEVVYVKKQKRPPARRRRRRYVVEDSESSEEEEEEEEDKEEDDSIQRRRRQKQAQPQEEQFVITFK